MTIEEFAESRRFRVTLDGCRHPVIPGKRSAKDMPDKPEYRSHVYDGFSGGRLGVCLMFTTRQKWNRVRAALESAGAKLKQNGDTAGCFGFDPANEQQVAAVVKAAGIKPRRVAAPAQIANLQKARTLPTAA